MHVVFDAVYHNLYCCFYFVVYWFVFFFKQKTAYEMRISDWSSDVCSSDLRGAVWSSLWPLSCTCSVARMGATTWDRPADPSIIASLSTMLVASAAIQRHAFTVVLVWSQEFDSITDVIAMERRVKGWSRIKKEALIRGDYNELKRDGKRTRMKPSH